MDGKTRQQEQESVATPFLFHQDASPEPVEWEEESAGVAVYDYSEEWDDDEEVPFSHQPFSTNGDDTPFDVAERIVEAFGLEFAKLVCEEVERWGAWQ